MATPIEIEKAFIDLIDELNSSQSFRQKWEHIYDFFKLIENDFSSYDTYCLQVVSHLPIIQDPLSITGCDPVFFEKILGLLLRCSEDVTELQSDEHFHKVRTSIECSIIFLHSCLNQLESGLKKVDRNFSPVGNNNRSDILSVLDWYQQYYKNEENGHLLDCLLKVESWWQEIEHDTESMVYVPVVEEQTGSYDVGRLRALHSRVIGKRSDQDLYERYYAVFGAEKGESNYRQHLAHCVREVVNQVYPRRDDTFFHLQFSYRFKLGVEIGRSSELAMLLSAFCSISESLDDRNSFTPAQNMALSGSVGDGGKVNSVDPHGIQSKVEAAYFSWIPTLVVPDFQKGKFEQSVVELQKKYPFKSLAIIGIDNVKDVIYDRRIAKKKIESRAKFYLKKAWDKKFNIASLLIIAALLMIIGAMWYGPIDKNPARGVFGASVLRVYNKGGDLLKKFKSGYRNEKLQRQNGNSGNEPNVQFLDITGDGVNEIFYAKYPYSDLSPRSTLTAWSLTGDSLIWEYTLNFDIKFPKKNSIVDDRFFLREFHLEQVNGEILIVGNSDLNALFPSVVFTLDAREGTIKQRYVHPGHFYAMELKDLNTDGVREAVLTGVNNAYWQAVITALDLEDLQGHGPKKGDYVINGYSRADERHYVMVPKTVVGKYYEPIQKSNRGLRIREKAGDDLIYFEVLDAPYQDFEGMSMPPYIILYMNNQFKPVGIGTSDLYDIMARDLYQEGNIPFIPDYEYFEAFKDSLEYVE